MFFEGAYKVDDLHNLSLFLFNKENYPSDVVKLFLKDVLY